MNTSKSKLLSAAIATIVSATIIGTTMVPDAQAGKRGKWIALGVGAGIIGTAIVANERRKARDRRYYRESRWERHVNRCYRRYRSYDESTDTYIGYDGYERRCRL